MAVFFKQLIAEPRNSLFLLNLEVQHYSHKPATGPHPKVGQSNSHINLLLLSAARI